MLATPAAAAAAASVAEFDATVRSDLEAVIRFAAGRGILEPAEGAELISAFGMLPGEGRLPSEFFWIYFSGLEALQTGRPADARQALLLLGNLLLDQQVLRGQAISEALPAFRDDRGLPSVAGPADCYLSYAGDPVTQLGSAARAKLGQQIRGTWRQAGTLRVRTSTGVIDRQVRKYDAYTCELSGRSPALGVLAGPGATSSDPIADRAAVAADLIRSLDPETAGEISLVTEYLVLLEGSDFVGGSDIRLFGASFLRLSPDWSPLCYADHLVHEAAHQRLHAAHELVPMLSNKDYVGAPSPIRSDPRPLYGTLHATFVFLRLSQFMARVLRQSADDTVLAEAEIRFHRHLLGLLQGLRTVADYGELTEAGAVELAEWKAVASDLLSVAGPPDERIFSKLDWDYERANPALPMLALRG